ncbi:MAG: hypothetical protein AB7F59_09990 [Bdellovibrionales bacterium]
MLLRILLFISVTYGSLGAAFGAPHCSKVLQGVDLVTTGPLRPFSMRREENKIIFRRSDVTPPKTMVYSVSQTKNPYKNWQVLETQFEGKTYQLLPLSISQLHDIHDQFTAHIRRHIRTNDDYDVIVGVNGEALKTEVLWMRYRWAFHAKVIDSYSDKKGYLRATDLALLDMINRMENNYDVYGVFLKPSGTDFSKLTQEEIKTDLFATIQVTYRESYQYDFPNAHEMFPERLGSKETRMELLPFQWRLDEMRVSARPFTEVFNVDFKNRRLAEITRYAKFEQLPAAIQAKMIMQALVTGAQKGVQTFIISVDPATQILFGRLGFQDYKTLPIGQSETPEALMYMHTGSEKYKKLIQNYKRQSDGLTFDSVPFIGLSK